MPALRILFAIFVAICCFIIGAAKMIGKFCFWLDQKVDAIMIDLFIWMDGE